MDQMPVGVIEGELVGQGEAEGEVEGVDGVGGGMVDGRHSV